MTAPPENARPAAAVTTTNTRSPKSRRAVVLALGAASVFALVYLSHLPLLGLPYYWDEAGYFIPAARDIYRDGSFVPHSTLSNAHPPLVMAWIALAWKLFGFSIPVARAAVLFVSVLTLLGVYKLSERVANARVAAATVLCTALYPVFFAQSSLAHLDMAVAALTVWGLVFYLPGTVGAGLVPARPAGEEDGRGQAVPPQNHSTSEVLSLDNTGVRRGVAVALFALAGLAKETAILVPLTLFGWEFLCLLAGRSKKASALVCLERRSPARSLTMLLALLPLAAWFAFHYSRTGYVFGNPEYFRYNVESTVNLARILEALWRRLGHVTAHMNLWVLTLAGLAAMLLRPRRDAGRVRARIAVPTQLLFAALVLAHVVALSVVGGAILARYMLPVLPLVILVWVSTLWRRVPAWALAVALVCGAFAYRTVVNPPHSFPWEENLAYRDFILLHRDAARFLSSNYADARVLTTWPASDELKNPYYGYLDRPLRVFAVENFLRETLERAARQKSDYDVALLYSTHGGLELEEAARLLGGRVVFREERKGQWAAVLEIQKAEGRRQ